MTFADRMRAKYNLPEPQPDPVKPVSVVVARLNIGDTIIIQGRRVTITALTDDYQRNTIAAFKTATVTDVDGVEREVKLYANQRYQREG